MARTFQINLPGIKVATHSNLGKDFESDLEAVHDFYRLRCLADVRKIPNGWKLISETEYKNLQSKLPSSHLARTDGGSYMQRVKSDVDFSGGGKTSSGKLFAIVFDAKQTNGSRFPLSNIEEHQLLKLKSRFRCGIVSGIMLQFNEADRVFFVPFEYLDARFEIWLKGKITRRRAAKGIASISIEEASQNSIEIYRHRQNMLWDWHAAFFPING